MRMIILVAGIITACVMAVSCTHKTDLTGLPTVSFSKQIQPLLISNCALTGCHASGTAGGGEEEHRPLTTYTEIMTLVSAGKPTKSRLYNSIIGSGEQRMPIKSSYLSEYNTELIYVWIVQGAQNN